MWILHLFYSEVDLRNYVIWPYRHNRLISCLIKVFLFSFIIGFIPSKAIWPELFKMVNIFNLKNYQYYMKIKEFYFVLKKYYIAKLTMVIVTLYGFLLIITPFVSNNIYYISKIYYLFSKVDIGFNRNTAQPVDITVNGHLYIPFKDFLFSKSIFFRFSTIQKISYYTVYEYCPKGTIDAGSARIGILTYHREGKKTLSPLWNEFVYCGGMAPAR